MSQLSAPVSAPIHVPPVDDPREPKTRRKMMRWDRIKVEILLAAIILFSALYEQSNIPIMTFWEALRSQIQAKTWIIVLMGLVLFLTST